MYVGEFKWSGEFGEWWFGGAKQNLKCPITMHTTIDNLPGFYYSNLMEFASACFEAGRNSITQPQTMTEAEQIEEVRKWRT